MRGFFISTSLSMIYPIMENKKLIIDILSDTHNRHEKFKCEGGDILLHSGDFTSRGEHDEVESFMRWMAKQNYTHKVVIPGNHDWDLEKNFDYWQKEFATWGIHLLNDSGVEIEGIKIWGSPVQPWFHSWAFNRARNQSEADHLYPRVFGLIKPHWDAIPKDTEILLTHGPPYNILDTVVRGGHQVGCVELAKAIEDSEIKLHVFGHIHEGRGFHYGDKTTYVNGSSLNEYYSPSDNKPMRAIREVCQDGSIVYVL